MDSKVARGFIQKQFEDEDKYGSYYHKLLQKQRIQDGEEKPENFGIFVNRGPSDRNKL